MKEVEITANVTIDINRITQAECVQMQEGACPRDCDDGGQPELEDSDVGSDPELGLDGLEGLHSISGSSHVPTEQGCQRSAERFGSFLRDAAAGGANMHLAAFWDEFYAKHPCCDGFQWYVQWCDIDMMIHPVNRSQVLVSGVGDDVRFCMDLTTA